MNIFNSFEVSKSNDTIKIEIKEELLDYGDENIPKGDNILSCPMQHIDRNFNRSNLLMFGGYDPVKIEEKETEMKDCNRNVQRELEARIENNPEIDIKDEFETEEEVDIKIEDHEIKSEPPSCSFFDNNNLLRQIHESVFPKLNSGTIKGFVSETELSVVRPKVTIITYKPLSENLLPSQKPSVEQRVKIKNTIESKYVVNSQDKMESKKFKCSDCSFRTVFKRDLERHVTIHSKKKYKCSYCDYVCDRKYIVYHSLSHLQAKILKCSECDFKCIEEQSLRKHSLTHLNVKLFQCPKCDYGSNVENEFRTHVFSHSPRRKVFNCSECDYECYQKVLLKRHTLTHFKTKLFKCSECSFETNHKGYMKTHSSKHSKIILVITKNVKKV